jgi:hypothetical protein
MVIIVSASMYAIQKITMLGQSGGVFAPAFMELRVLAKCLLSVVPNGKPKALVILFHSTPDHN